MDYIRDYVYKLTNYRTDIYIDLLSCSLFVDGNWHLIKMEAVQYELLCVLARNRGQVLTFSQIVVNHAYWSQNDGMIGEESTLVSKGVSKINTALRKAILEALGEDRANEVLGDIVRKFTCVKLYKKIGYQFLGERITRDNIPEKTNKTEHISCQTLVKGALPSEQVRDEKTGKGLSFLEKSEEKTPFLYIPRKLYTLQSDGTRRYINEVDVLCNIEGIKCLIAPGGNGKSTLVSHSAYEYGSQCKLTSCLCLCHAVDEKTDVPKLLGANNTAFVFDGIDEIPSIHLKNTLLGIVARHALNQTANILFTTRTNQDVSVISEYFNCPVTEIYLDDFSPEDCELYVEHFLGDRAENFWWEFQYIELSTYECYMTEFLFSPFYLKHLVQLYEQEGTLPYSKNALLEFAVAMFLKKESVLETANYSDLVRRFTIDELENILKHFARRKFENCNNVDDVALLRTMLKEDFQLSPTYAGRIYSFLHDRGLLVNGMFEHRLMQEYLVASCFFDECNEATIAEKPIRELFSHSNDPYWQEVVKLFLGICEGRVSEARKVQLYAAIVDAGVVSDYTPLFDFFSEAINYCYCIPQIKLFLKDILTKSINGYYTTDSPLFFYVPKYRFYSELNDLLDDEDFQVNENAHILVRDVFSLGSSLP